MANFRRGMHSFGVERLGKQVSENINCAIRSPNYTFVVEHWRAAFERKHRKTMIENIGEQFALTAKS